MAPDRRDLSSPLTDPLFGKAGQRAIKHPGDDVDSSQMREEGCPNESASVADATGHSGEEKIESTMCEGAS